MISGLKEHFGNQRFASPDVEKTFKYGGHYRIDVTDKYNILV